MFYGLEAPIVEHLQTACPSIAFVAGVVDPAAINNNLQLVQPIGAPGERYGAVFVCPHPDFIGELARTARGECQLNSQRWVLAICSKTKNAETAYKGAAVKARVDNGPLVIEVMQAMHSLRWTAVGDARPGLRDLQRVAGGSLPGVIVYGAEGVYATLLTYEADLTGPTSTLPGTTYPTITLPTVQSLIAQALADHIAALDPHAQYTTEAEATAIAQAAVLAAGAGPIGPELTYGAGGRIDRVDYDDGSYKLLSYDPDFGFRLSRVDYVHGLVTTRKDLVYNPDGSLHEIVQSEL